jgi:hypothetical protein
MSSSRACPPFARIVVPPPKVVPCKLDNRGRARLSAGIKKNIIPLDRTRLHHDDICASRQRMTGGQSDAPPSDQRAVVQ